MKSLSRSLRIGGAISLVVLGLTAAIPPLGLSWVNQARDQREQVVSQIVALQHVQASLVDAETGQRGFVITGKEEFLEPYTVAVMTLKGQFASLQDKYADESPAEQQSVARIIESGRSKLGELARVVALRRAGGFAPAEAVVSAGAGRQYMEEVRAGVDRLVQAETSELSQLDDALRVRIVTSIVLSLAGTVIAVLLLIRLGRMLFRAVRDRERAADAAHDISQRVAESMSIVQRKNDQISALSDMSRVLQTDLTLVEALQVCSTYCARLLPGSRGAIYLFRNSADMLELASQWGDHAAPVWMPAFQPGACWGLKLGQAHARRNGLDLLCPHCGGTAPVQGHDVGALSLCVPLIAFGDTLGLMHLQAGDGDKSDETIGVAKTIAEQISLSVSNVKLQAVLRDQSIKDPLTGLYNRRYMEETLARELIRSQRTGTSLSVVVADLDHFKKINDLHGHPAGDAVLRAAARFMKGKVRGSDVACRFGGEEFVMILPDCSADVAADKAQQMCDGLRALIIQEGGQSLTVTASIGVATFPVNGETPEELFQAADAALYQAKRSGRDKVIVAGHTAQSRIAISKAA